MTDRMRAPESARDAPGYTPAIRWFVESPRSALVAIVVAVVGGLLLGGLTSVGQQYLPAWINSLANSAGGWTMFAFLLVWLGRPRLLLGAVLGVLAFEALVEGYAIVSAWRGFFYQAPFSGLFNLIGLVAGPVVGVAAALTRYGSRGWAILGVAPLSAVLIGEGVWALRTVADTTSPVYWWLEIVLGVVFLVAAVVRRRPSWSFAVAAVILTVTGAALFLLGYGLLG